MNAPRSSRGAATRSAVLDAARAVLVEDGLDRFVLREIAARVGITLGNLQYYFATRDDLLEAVIRGEFDRDLAAFCDEFAAPSTPAAQLGDICRRLVENWCTGGGSVFAALSLLAYHHDRFARLNTEIYASFYAEVGALLRRIDPGASASEVAERTALVTSVLDGVAMQVHAGAFGGMTCDDLLDCASALVGTIATGGALSPRGRARTRPPGSTRLRSP
jgi:AcrR family transcriptional regulator